MDVNATDLLDRTLKQPSLSVVTGVDLNDCLINQKFSDATQTKLISVKMFYIQTLRQRSSFRLCAYHCNIWHHIQRKSKISYTQIVDMILHIDNRQDPTHRQWTGCYIDSGQDPTHRQ